MRRWTREQKNIIFAIGILLLFLSAPLYMDYLLAGNRLGIYFLEEEGIRGPFLWLPVLLYRLGLSIQGSCKLYIFTANLVSLVVSWYCFRKIAGNSYAGLAGSFCYNFSIYSVYIRYFRASLGEMTAFIFLPLVALGLYRVYTENVEEKGYWRAGLPFGIGLLGTFLSSIPLAMVVTGFVVLVALVLFKRTFRKKTFFVLAISGVAVFGLSAGITVPYMRQMLAGRLYAEDLTGSSFAARSFRPAQLFLPILGEATYDADVRVSKEYMSLGLPFLAVLAAWGWICLSGKKEEHRQEKRTAAFLCGISAVSIIMCTKIFPWGAIQKLHWLPRVLLEHVGYPYRFLVAAVLLLSIAVSILGKLVWEKGKKAMLVFLLAVTVTNVLSGVYLMDALLYTTAQSHSYEADAPYQEAEYLFYISE